MNASSWLYFWNNPKIRVWIHEIHWHMVSLIQIHHFFNVENCHTKIRPKLLTSNKQRKMPWWDPFSVLLFVSKKGNLFYILSNVFYHIYFFVGPQRKIKIKEHNVLSYIKPLSVIIWSMVLTLQLTKEFLVSLCINICGTNMGKYFSCKHSWRLEDGLDQSKSTMWCLIL